MAVHRLTLVYIGRQELYLDQNTSVVHLLKNRNHCCTGLHFQPVDMQVLSCA